MDYFEIKENVEALLKELSKDVELVAACKSRKLDEIRAAIDGGVKIIGENFVQEAEKAFRVFGTGVKWHFIGHLQKNKVKKAVEIFDMVETVDSVSLAEELDKRCQGIDKIMPILIEVNSAREEQKFGVYPENVEKIIRKISELKNIKVNGLMTMGPLTGDPEEVRPYFIETRKCFEGVKVLDIPLVEMTYLSMGMTNSYKIAIEEGANIVRIGTRIFGERA